MRRLTHSTLLAVAAGVATLLAVPRAYDYDKALLYPLGLLVIWRYVERRDWRRMIALAAVIVVAGLYRYDNGIYVAAAALVAVVADAGLTMTAVRRLVTVFACSLLLAAPALWFIQQHGGLRDAVDQMLTYGMRERARTHLSRWPRLSPGRLATIDPPSMSRVIVRWAPWLDAPERAASAARLGLRDEMPETPSARTWSYAIEDDSTAGIRRVVNDPVVEDTGRIDRGRLVLEHPPSLWTRLDRRAALLRVRLLPDFWDRGNAGPLLFYLAIALPLFALASLVVHRRDPSLRPLLPAVASLAVLCLIVDALILRDPLEARVGGIAGLPIALGAWLATRVPRRRGWITFAGFTCAACLAVVSLDALSVTADWRRLITPTIDNPMRVRDAIRVLSDRPPSLEPQPAGRGEAMIAYVNRCTQPMDRVFASWFFPELYWYAERPFAGGMVVVFGHHWMERRFQERMVRALAAQRPPIVLIDAPNYGEFRDVYPLVDQYFTAHYRIGGSSNFGDKDQPADAYRVLVPIDRAPTSTDPTFGLPCFVG